MANSKHQTQWSAQFFLAAELVRRGYLVTFTLGNAPNTDLLIKSPNGKIFRIEVKGLSKPNAWLLKENKIDKNLFYVFILIPPIVQNEDIRVARIFLLTSKEAMSEVLNYKQQVISKGGKYHDKMGGFNWSAVIQHENEWNKLPD